MNEQRQDNTLAIVAIVLGGLGFALSIIPCIGFLSIPLGVIGLILAAIAYFKAKDNGDRKTLSIVALVVSFLPLLISAMYYFTFSSNFTNLERDYSYIQSCDTLQMEIERVQFITDSIENVLEQDDGGASVFGNMSTITSQAIKLVKLQEQAAQLGCEFIREEGGIIDIDDEIEFDSLENIKNKVQGN